jgi:oxalate decarboxylase/phosphoglucose isomerase-like protein (cupin superfamily)
MNKPVTDLNHPKLLLDPYASWVEKEGIPVTEDFGIDLFKVPVQPWARFGVDGGIAHLKGRGDFLSIFVLDLKPGAATDPQKHMVEEVVYVLSGHGSTTVETSDGRKHSFEWGPKSLFALPLNARYRHFNSSGQEHARIASTNNLCMMLNLFHNEDFVFANGYDFPERQGSQKFFSGEGEFIPVRPGRNMWETNFVPDLASFELKEWAARGAGGSNMMFVLADGTMHAHISQMPVGTYKKGHRHGADFHVYSVTGHGYSLLWYEGEPDFVRVDWQHGVVFAPPDQMFHQHFNTSPDPARYLAVAFGGLRYPFTESKRHVFMGMDVSVKDGGCQIEYENQDARIHGIFLSELAKHGAPSKMQKFIDEAPYLKDAASAAE